MNFRLLIYPRLVRFLPLVSLIIGLLLPVSTFPSAQAIEVIVEDPQLHPAYTTCPQTYWYPFDNDRGHSAYLTLNTDNPLHSTNYGEWHPVIPQAGYYRVEAYIAGHAPVIWCTGEGRTINNDSTDAHYSIHHANGVSNRSLSQYPLSNQWLSLGEYYFNAGDSGYVYLSDFNAETEYSTTMAFSAMRFTFTRSGSNIYLPLVNLSDPSGRPPPDAGVIQAQGFDVCGLPSIAKMQTWWNESPYSLYGLYLGGIQLPSTCAGVDAAWVRAVHQQGWSFIPTWVGPQAPCSIWSQKMSSDPAVSYQQGRQEAEAASTRAASLGLTNYGLGGTVIYYDMEVFGGASTECRLAASSFINGWVERLHELGNIAGGYGSHNSYVEDWATLAHIPDDVWAASWYTEAYDPYASVFSIPWLQGLWTNHQRIRQYAGDHHESWGGIGIAIDSNVADGVVAMPHSNPLAISTVIAGLSIEDAGWLSSAQGWLVSGNRLYWTNDRGINWTDISPAPIQLAYFLPSGQTWALSTQNHEQTSLYHSSNWGATWEYFVLTLPPDAWWPLQLQFSSPTTGWVVMQKETSQAFDIGILMKTIDGGITWQSTDLPTAGKINFTSQAEGWLLNTDNDELYQTTDGGVTWQIAQRKEYLLSQPHLPESTSSSGWQANGLGWAATSRGSCNGEKSSPDFSCQVNTALWQTQDGGETWQEVHLPDGLPIKQ
jgi:photosystem II stability/assembly factor-like uncharacterized protein